MPLSLIASEATNELDFVDISVPGWAWVALVGFIFALLAFGHLFGFVGVLVALPLSAVALVALNRLRAAYLASRLFTG